MGNWNNQTEVEFIRTKELSKLWKAEILELWNKEYPNKLIYKSFKDFENYLEILADQSHIVMMDENQNIKGWYFDYIRDGGKWFAILLDSNIQGQGFGTQLLKLAKEGATELNAWVIDHDNDLKQNGEYYKSPLPFYLKNGFEKLSGIRLELDKLSAVKIRWSA